MLSPENMMILESEKFDIGNTGANVVALVVPVKCKVDSVTLLLYSGATSNVHVSLDSLSGATQGAEDIGSIEVPAGASAFASYYDLAGRGVNLNAGDKILVQVDDAGDSGEFARVAISLQYDSEVAQNVTTQTVTA